MYNNIIKKSIIDFQFNGKADGFTLQQDVGNWCHQNLLPAIDNVLKKYETREDIISIDNLEIDVTIDSSGEWLNTASKEIIPLVEKQISSRITEKTASIKTPDKAFKELLSYFLEHGFLPWNNLITTKEEFNEHLSEWFQSTTEENIFSIASRLKNEFVIRRFLNHVFPSDFVHFISRITRTSKEKINAILKDVKLSTEITTGRRVTLLNDFKKIMLQQISIASSENLLLQSIHLWIEQVIKKQPFVLRNIDPEKLQSSEFIEEIKIQRKNLSLKKTDIVVDNPNEDNPHLSPTAKPELHLKLEGKKPEIEKESNPVKIIPEVEEGIYINNAGSVIVAPFLPAFFSRTSLIKEKTITNSDKAVNLLYYIITGKEHPAEFQLVLPKILCGVPIEQPVDTNINISEVQKHETNELLRSVIKNWSALKNTSVDGLRVSFLQREGRLNFTNNEWLLTVEQKGYDILLSQLPWTISFIYLPWMKSRLKVDWI